LDGYVDGTGIDVDVRNGVVTLSGSVGSVAEKNRATTIAWTAGTKAVDIDGLKVTQDGKERRSQATERVADFSDAAILNAVEARIGLGPYASKSDIDVRVQDRVVTLSGHVPTVKAKRMANTVAAQTDGVLLVRNRLGVRRDGAVPGDAELKDRIDNALAVNAITESYEIAVAVQDGNVSLTGEVDNWFEKGAADDVAASVRGVRSVDNDLEVDSSAQRLAFDPYVDPWSVYDFQWYQPDPATSWKQDSVLAREIEQELRWSPFVDADDIDVQVEEGVATLTGTVNSVAESNAAQENAFEGGAVGVVNKLRIQS
jgi:osmotically-inducible protein OsmY